MFQKQFSMADFQNRHIEFLWGRTDLHWATAHSLWPSEVAQAASKWAGPPTLFAWYVAGSFH
jgi:hypothetical protein